MGIERAHSGGDLVHSVGQVLVNASIPGVALQAQIHTVSHNLGAFQVRPEEGHPKTELAKYSTLFIKQLRMLTTTAPCALL